MVPAAILLFGTEISAAPSFLPMGAIRGYGMDIVKRCNAVGCCERSSTKLHTVGYQPCWNGWLASRGLAKGLHLKCWVEVVCSLSALEGLL
jgi:hypothetical protein